MDFINLLIFLLFTRHYLGIFKLLNAFVQFSPVIFWTVITIQLALVLTRVVVSSWKILTMSSFLVYSRPLGTKPRFCRVFLCLLMMGRALLTEQFGCLIVFDTLVELLSFFPGNLDVRLAFRLKIFELLGEILIMILAFFYYLVEIVLLIFGGFL